MPLDDLTATRLMLAAPKRTGKPCTLCGAERAYLALNSMCVACYEQRTIGYYAMLLRDAEARLTTVQAFEAAATKQALTSLNHD